jgi:ubiquinone/menaquinone biosynthesis C-methylase UbiE
VKVADAVAVAGHEVHVCRYREARTLLRWLGQDLRGLRVLDVAGGDGYWAARARGHGARAVALDLADAKPAAPLVAASDRAAHDPVGAIVLVRARRGRQAAASREGSANR